MVDGDERHEETPYELDADLDDEVDAEVLAEALAEAAAVPIGRGAPATRASSSIEERERLVAEALAHAEARDAAYRRPLRISRDGWKTLLALVVLLLAGTLAVAPPPWLRGEPLPEVSAAERSRGTRAALAVQARQIEAFRIVHQRLPVSLSELPTALPGVRYVRSTDRVYQLVAYGPDGRAVVWDSARPSPDLREAGSGILGGDGAP